LALKIEMCRACGGNYYKLYCQSVRVVVWFAKWQNGIITRYEIGNPQAMPRTLNGRAAMCG